MSKLSKQRVFAILLASIMTVNIAGMSTFYATDEFVPTETNITENVSTDGDDFQNAIPLNINGEEVAGSLGDEDTYNKVYKVELPEDGALTIEFAKQIGGIGSAVNGNLYSAHKKIKYNGVGADYINDIIQPKIYYLYKGTYYFKVDSFWSNKYTLKANFKGINVKNNVTLVTTPNDDYKHAIDISLGQRYHNLLAERQNTQNGNWYKFTLDEKTDLTIKAIYSAGKEHDFKFWKVTNDNEPESEYFKNLTLYGTPIAGDENIGEGDISLDAGTYYITFDYGNYNAPCEYEFWIKKQGTDDPDYEIPTDPTGETEPEPDTEPETETQPVPPPITEPETETQPTTPPVTDPTKTTNPIPSPTPNPSNTTGGNSTNGNANTTPGKVATGDTKSIIGLFAGLFATAGIIFASRKKRSTK